MNEYHKLIDKILQFFAGEQFQDEIRLAKREFFENSSVFDETSSNFELRMSQFFDWYFFTRKLRGYDCTPVEAALLPRELKYTPDEVNMIGILKQHRNSIFEYVKTKDTDLCIKDLMTDKKIWVKESPFLNGFSSVELFQVRIVPVGDNYIFMRGFCFHPPESRKYILKEVKKHQKNSDLSLEKFLLRLVKMRYKYEQYKHVNIDMIYCDHT